MFFCFFCIRVILLSGIISVSLPLSVKREIQTSCLFSSVLSQVVVMNGCGSLFSALAATLCDPEGIRLAGQHRICVLSCLIVLGL